MRLVVVSFVLGLAACNTPPDQERRDVCTAICDCLGASTPVQLEECIVDECFPVVTNPSEECLSCIYTFTQTCGVVLTDCADLCIQQFP